MLSATMQRRAEALVYALPAAGYQCLEVGGPLAGRYHEMTDCSALPWKLGCGVFHTVPVVQKHKGQGLLSAP